MHREANAVYSWYLEMGMNERETQCKQKLKQDTQDSDHHHHHQMRFDYVRK